MNTITITWIAFPFFFGFLLYLLPKLDRYLALGVTFVSAAFAVLLFVTGEPVTLELVDSFGVTLVADQLSGYFILANAQITAAVILYCWGRGKTAFFIHRRSFYMAASTPHLPAPILSVYMWH